ncbi:MAG: DMT family transporter [Bacteroidales bacterium]|nr:DMT family transporter [Bacteroidales bacterium]
MRIKTIKPTTIGYFLATATTITAVNTYFTSKFILNKSTLFQFGILWYGFGLLYNFLFQLFTNKLSLYNLSKKQILILLLFLFLETLSTSSFFYAIQLMENPAMVSFIGNLTPALVTLFGIIILKEHFTRFELIGVLLTIIGSFLVSFRWQLDWSHLFIKGSGYVYLTVLAVSINTIWVKKHIDTVHPSLLSTGRVVALLLFSILFLYINKQPLLFSKSLLFLAAYGSFVGPFLGSLLGYYALKYIPASRSILIQSVKSFLILLTAYWLLNLLPLTIQMVGGCLTVLGVIIITGKPKKI